MYRRLSLLAFLGLMLTACVPYGGHGYYRSDVYTVDRYGYPGYSRPAYPYNRGYYVVPQQPRYYTPAPRYYQPAPNPGYRHYPNRGGWDARSHQNNPGWNRGWDRGRDRDDGRGHRGDWRGNQNHQGDRDDRGRGRYH